MAKSTPKKLAAVKAWQQQNKDKKRQYDKRYYETHKDQIRAYRQCNKDKKAFYDRTYYDKHKEAIRAYHDGYYHKEVIQRVKLHYGCMNPFCEWTAYKVLSPYLLDFHHGDATTKKFNIGQRRSVSRSLLVAEINKCTILCAMCHRLVSNNLLDDSIFETCRLDADGVIVET